MMGEELSTLTVKELQGLENQLEISLRGVRMRKVCNSYLIQMLSFLKFKKLQDSTS